MPNPLYKLFFVKGFEHLMHKLGIGGIDFPEKHTLDQHRSSGYKVPDFEEETSTVQNVAIHETTTGMCFACKHF